MTNSLLRAKDRRITVRTLPIATITLCVAVLAACGGSGEAGAPKPSPSARGTLPTTEAGPFVAELATGLSTEVDVPYTATTTCGDFDCSVPLDVLAPGKGRALPTVVLVPGGPVEFHERRYLDRLAAGVARRGAVVFLVSYRSTATGNTAEDSLADVRCTVRYARSVASAHRGDPERVVLVGHSIGSTLVLRVAVTPETDTPHCRGAGDAAPQAVVGLSEFDSSLSGTAPPGPPMLLIGGSEDRLSEPGPATAEQLTDAGFRAEYRELAGTSHQEMVDPGATPAVLDAIFEAAALAAEPSG